MKTITDLQRQLFCHGLASAGESRIALNALDTCNLWPPKNPVTNPDQYWVYKTIQANTTVAKFLTIAYVYFIANGKQRNYSDYRPGNGCQWKFVFRNNFSTRYRLLGLNDFVQQH